MTTWFTADTHFGHAAIIDYCRRPFASVGEMEAVLIANWNSRIRKADQVWHLGDFAFGGADIAAGYLSRLSGRIHLVHGNHDRPAVRALPGWASSQAMADIKVEDTRLVLLHYGMRVWTAMRHGTLHLYGHSHGRLPGTRQSLDVGVDAWGYFPVALAEIKARLAEMSADVEDG